MKSIVSGKKMLQSTARRLALFVGVFALMAPLAGAWAATGDMSQSSLLLASPVKPNVMLTVDNSGSMAWNTLTSYDTSAEYDSTGATRAYYSSSYNKLYYNPEIRYLAANNYDNTARSDSTLSSAWLNPFLVVGTGTGQRDNASNKVDLSVICYSQSSIDNLSLPIYNTSDYTYSGDSYTYTSATHGPNKCSTTSTGSYTTKRARFAYYYVWNGSTNIAVTGPANSAFTSRVDIISENAPFTRGKEREDCTYVSDTQRSCSLAQEQTNFANWFSYYRSRIYTVQTGTSLAFSVLDGNYRVGYGEINASGTTVDGVSTNTVKVGVRDFTGTDKQAWFENYLYKVAITGSTPLRRAMNDVGVYYSRSDNKGPWSATPGTTNTTVHIPCRKSFHLLMTDGYWNYGSGSTSDFPAAPTNGDDTAGSVITGTVNNVTTYYKYDPSQNQPAINCTSSGCTSCSPINGTSCFASSYYNSAQAKTLADVAMYYWKRDLRTDLDNKVPPSEDDPAFWQHVTQFTVGLGVNGSIPYTTANINGVKMGTVTWPNQAEGTMKDSNYSVDDLWHAAVNGHGSYYSAADPVTFREGLLDALNKISKVAAVGASDAVSAENVTTGEYLFEPSFTSSLWEGHLRAYPWVEGSLAFSSTASWDAATVLPVTNWSVACTASIAVPNCRNIVTMVGGVKKDFVWGSFSTAQQTSYFGGKEDALKFLRGDATNEVSSTNLDGIYRERKNTKFGDIVNSSPLYVKQGAVRGYSNLTGIGASYQTFLTNAASYKKTRPAIVYVGANDGMLHAFRADTGVEVYAYVPESVHSNLIELTKRTYPRNHKYFVDGQITEGDAYLGGAWKTVLLATTGAGAKSVFAIDITDPKSDYSGLTTNSVMWEKSAASESDADMGYIPGEAEVARMANGKWVAIHGNGFASTNYKAVLYIRDLSDGSVIQKIDTGVGSVSLKNGLSNPVLLRNRNYEVTAAYAGDLQGNLWKFDLSSTSSTPTWNVAYSGSPMFKAPHTGIATTQPIIQKPQLKSHPNGGYVVIFGTGKFFQEGDESNSDTQSIYGIWDKPGATATVTSLKHQTLTASGSGYTVSSGTVNWTSESGWYVDMVNAKERAIANPLIVDDVAYVKTLKPGGDSCSAGGDAYLYRLDYLNGSSTAYTLAMVPYSSGSTGGLTYYRASDGTSTIFTPTFTPGGQEKTPLPPSTATYRNWRRLSNPIWY